MWLELAREGYEPLKRFATNSILPNIIVHYNLTMGHSEQVKRLIYWRFFDQIPETPSYLLNAMQRLISETKFETPFLETIERLTSDKLNGIFVPSTEVVEVKRVVQRKARKQFYVYSLHNSKSIDIRGAINYFGGAGHTSDLLYMGPSLFQQISRRKLTSAEMRLCRKFRHLFSEFIKTGNPTPGVHTSNAWHPYTSKRKFIQILSDTRVESNDATFGTLIQDNMFTSTLEKNFPEIDRLIHDQARIVSSNNLNPFRIGEENLPNSPVDSVRMSKTYLGVNSSSEYYNTLSKIHSFWRELLPKISVGYDQNYSDGIYSRSNIDDKLFISMMATSNTKFKHAFFSMLFLVCLLLVVLCICMYILKKNQQHIGVSFL